MISTKIALLATTAVVGSLGAACAQTIEFTPVPFANTDAMKRQVLATPSVTYGGVTNETGYHILARSGDKIGGNVFAELVDQNGLPVTNADGSVHISVDADFTSLLPVGDKLFSVTHFESRPGAMYLSELSQDADTGMLTPISTRPVDFSEFGGLWVPCAGSVTPWGTHLGSEEYEPDARSVFEAASLDDIDDYFKPMARFFGVDPDTMTLEQFRDVFNPYHYGWLTEVAVSADGKDTVKQHLAAGRMAFELGYVMPDQKTVYMSDDGTNVGFYMFVADEAGNLDAGTLYAEKWHQTSGDGAGAADLTWVNLGHATSDEIRKIVESKPAFADIFDAVAPGEDGSCAAGFTSINTSAGQECLKVKDGMDMAASRLETRRYAAIKGATTELRKEEGITFDPATNKLFVSMSEVAKGMAKGSKQDKGGPDDVQLTVNECGAVYEFDLAADADMKSDYVAKSVKGLVAGIPTDYPENSEMAGNTCDIDGIANPDNVTFLTGTRTLIIGEDTGSGHQNDVIWAYDMETGGLTRVLSTPYGSETTSPYFYPNINGWSYIIAVVQHPYGESDEDKLADPTDAMAYVGYIGPMKAIAE
ncbi:PhoX family phosphatase [Tropicimonas sp. IMCC34043]|uniref:PhoX family protein n=1 Tax=Tropicimonas sp. IMCC34043 TaxID=2248760 RepID=UPI000E26C5BA|nr:alkaline phosphatase PhoX [Tropicimonas sp. IMCC34043]